MNILILGAGRMGQAIVFDLSVFSKFKNITIADNLKKNLDSAKNILKDKNIKYTLLDVKNKDKTKELFLKNDIVISAIPYHFNYYLTEIAIDTNTNFLDLGGNNNIVEKQLKLNKKAKEKKLIIIPDSGLAPGLVSVITKDVIDFFDSIDYVKIRVGGLPLKPIPPFNYQLVFSVNGLINEYVEDAIVLDNKKILLKDSMTDLEEINFPYPFGKMEAFLTSGGCSTLPYTFRYIIKYLDYKTIRYKGHCNMIKPILNLGFGSEKEIIIDNKKIIPRRVLIKLLREKIPIKGQDVVLLKVFSKGIKNSKKIRLTYQMIDYFDSDNNISAMMRTTGYPVSVIAQMIEKKQIKKFGVLTSENCIPPKLFFKELELRNIIINRKIENI